jgi:hypothetical protein
MTESRLPRIRAIKRPATTDRDGNEHGQGSEEIQPRSQETQEDRGRAGEIRRRLGDPGRRRLADAAEEILTRACRNGAALLALALLAACGAPAAPPAANVTGIAVPTPPPPPSARSEAGDPPARLAVLHPGTARFADVEKLLGAPNETETDKTPCGDLASRCMKTTVRWTYFQVKNGRDNALSSSAPVVLVFDHDGLLQSIEGEWNAMPARP